MLKFYQIIIISVFIIGLSCKENTIQPEFFGSIRGFVLNQEDSQPIADAGVSTNPPSSAIVTDDAGRFNLNDLPVGNYTVTISKEGFKKGSATVAVKDDRTTDATIFLEKNEGNTHPNAPQNPTPLNESLNQPTLLELKWSASDEDGDSLTFDIFLYKSNSPVPLKVASDYKDTTYLVEDLDYNTTYFWQIISKDNSNAFTNGNIWSFKTKEFPKNNILFTSRESGNYKIYSTNLSDTSVIKLTNTSRALWPRFNPNKTRIAFSSDESVVPHIYIMNRDGSDSKILTSIPVAGYHNYGIGFCWSNDGGRILYSNYDKLYSIDQNGANLNLIANAPANRHFREIDYSPLGNRIVALTIGSNIFDSEIYLTNSDGSNMTLLIDNLPGIMESPSFSPDGNKIIFTRDVSGHQVSNGRQLDARIFIMSINGSDTVDISINKPAGTNDLHPRFSPDGSKIIFENVINDGSSEKEVWIMDVQGNNRQKFLSNGEMPDWK